MAVALALSGCVTIGKYDALVARVDELEKGRSQLEETIQRDMQRLENLNSLLKDAKDTFQQSGADLLARLDQVEQRARANTGAIEETRFAFDRTSQLVQQMVTFMDQKFGATITVLPSNLPAQPEALFALGVERLQAGAGKEARAIFRQYLDKFPQGLNAPEAQFYIGETYLAEKAYDAALAEYQTVYTTYKSSAKMPEALLRIGDVLTTQRQCDKAKAVYDLVAREAGKSPQAAVAKERAKSLKDKCK
jgi:tol-pal system protein YbgF